MAFASVNNGQLGSEVRAAINGNFAQIASAGAGNLVAGQYYALGSYVAAAGATPGSTTQFMLPFPVTSTVTIAALAVWINTLEAGKLFGLAIYANNPATNRPTGTPLAETGLALSTATAGAVDAPLLSNVQLQPGWYWLAFQTNATSATWMVATPNNTINARFMGVPLINFFAGTANIVGGVQITNTFGTWPDCTTQTWGYLSSLRMPIPAVRYASVP